MCLHFCPNSYWGHMVKQIVKFAFFMSNKGKGKCELASKIWSHQLGYNSNRKHSMSRQTQNRNPKG